MGKRIIRFGVWRLVEPSLGQLVLKDSFTFSSSRCLSFSLQLFLFDIYDWNWMLTSYEWVGELIIQTKQAESNVQMEN